MHGSTKALSKRKCTTNAVAMATPGLRVICALVVWPLRTWAPAVPDIGCGEDTTAFAVYFPGGMFSSVQTLSLRLVKVFDSTVPSSCVPSTVTIVELKSKPGWPSTTTSTTSVPVSVLGGGGGGGE